MRRSGLILIDRALVHHPVVGMQKPEWFTAWVWMLCEASWKDRQISIAGETITLKRGQFSHSVRFLAEKWGWHRRSVERFLARLKKETMIGTSSGTGQLVVTICNYEQYQDFETYRGTLGGTASGTAEGQRETPEATPDKKPEQKDSVDLFAGKNAGDGKTDSSATILQAFNTFWAAYPKRGSHANPKKPAREKFERKVKDGTNPEVIIRGAQAYARHVQQEGTDPKFVAQAVTWLNQERWADHADADPESGDDLRAEMEAHERERLAMGVEW